MNKLLQSYVVDTQYPGVSGIEHLQMLRTRSKLAELEPTFGYEERRQLADADHRLLAHAAEFLAELSRFVDLGEERRRLQPPATQWWWYLDVLVQVTVLPMRQIEREQVTA